MMKGQIVTSDFTIAFFVFLGILLSILATWDSTTASITNSQIINNMERTGVVAADVLVRTGGSPSGWIPTNVVVLGLSDGEPNVLNENKTAMLLRIPYETARTLLGIQFDFYMEVNRTSGAVVAVNGTQATYGIAPVSGGNTTVVVRRLVMINGAPATLTLKVWS